MGLNHSEGLLHDQEGIVWDDASQAKRPQRLPENHENQGLGVEQTLHKPSERTNTALTSLSALAFSSSEL